MKHLLGPYRVWVFLFLIILIVVEAIWSWRRDRENYDLKESLTNTSILAGYITSKIVTAAYQLAILTFFSSFAFYHFQPGISAIILSFLATDFLYYWYHRASHTIQFFWAFHVVHHSSTSMNLTAAYRINWFSAFITPYFFIPAALLGLPPLYIAISVSLNLLYQFFMHTEAVGKIPLIEGIIDTPSAHRVHHGSNAAYIDKNYGGVFMIWDRLFGTYQPETEPVKYGITTGFVSYNPFKLIFHGFGDLVKGKINYKG
ncbi:MAG: sterol desaturase family protein [Bacteroidota bacterium]|nr:sterol desaturase family protein [Bacteroidota bacterium]